MINAKGQYASPSSVKLAGRTPFSDNRDRTLSYLRMLSADTMLYSFRRTFGVDTAGARAPGGWESSDVLLRGHSLGHFLSALSLAYASTGDAVYSDKLDYIVSELRSLQLMSRGDPAAFSTVCTPDNASPSLWSRDPSVWGEGYIGAYPPDQFALLEQLTPYPAIWAPYYTLHKLIAGVLECHARTGNSVALDVARGIGGWIAARLGAVPESRRREMWGLYIAGEYGGMNESLARLYEITGDEKYISAAKMFDNESVFRGLARGEDAVRGLHANQHIPQLVGAVEEYRATGDEYYRDAARSFFDIVRGRHMYSIGGVGDSEKFTDGCDLAAHINKDHNCETCATYNLLKLARALFEFEPERADYMDYYERALFNHILASQSPTVRRNMHAGVTYMMPIGPGARREYSDDYGTFTCCHGTGMENHVKYQDAQFLICDGDGGAVVYVNYLIPSRLSLPERGIEIAIDGKFPFDGYALTLSGGADYIVKLRVPDWASGPIAGGGDHMDESPYAVMEHKAGIDATERFTLGYKLRLEYTPDRLDGDSVASLLYGPFVMAAKDPSEEFITLDIGGRELSDLFRVSCNREAGSLCLVGFGREFVPMYMAHHDRCHTYFKIK